MDFSTKKWNFSGVENYDISEKDEALTNPTLTPLTGKRTRRLHGGGAPIPIWRLLLMMMMMMMMMIMMMVTMMMMMKRSGDNT